MKHIALTVAALTTCFTAVCSAASPAAPVPENLLACSKVQDPTERVKCYDSQIEAMKSQAAPAQTPAAVATTTAPATLSNGPRPVAAPNPPALNAPAATNAPAPATSAGAVAANAPALTSHGNAGTSPPAVPAPPPVPQSADAQFGREQLPPTARPPSPEPDSLLSNITAMQQLRPREFLISLANGQVWRQEGTQITTFIRVGQDAHIERGTMGSYRLWTDAIGEKNWVSVTRVR